MRTERGRRGTGGSAHARPRHICTETGLTPCHICTGTRLAPATSAPGLGLAPAPSEQGLGLSLPHLSRCGLERAQSWWRCGTPGADAGGVSPGEPSPGADVVRSKPSPCVDKAGVSPVPVQIRLGRAQPGADKAGVSPVPVRMRHGPTDRTRTSRIGRSVESVLESCRPKRQHANLPECTVSVPVQMLAGVSPIPAQMWRCRSRCRCGPECAISA